MFWQRETFTELENNLITSLAILRREKTEELARRNVVPTKGFFQILTVFAVLKNFVKRNSNENYSNTSMIVQYSITKRLAI